MQQTLESVGTWPTLTQAIKAGDRGIAIVEGLLMALACALFGLIMVIVSADAVGRYFFNSPLMFVNELVTRYLLPGGFFLAMAYTFRSGGHVAVEFIARRVSARRYQAIIGVLYGLSCTVIWMLAARGAAATYHSWATQEAVGGLYRWLIWPSELLVPVGLGLLALRVTHAAVANGVAAATGVTDIAYPAESAEAEIAFATASEASDRKGAPQ